MVGVETKPLFPSRAHRKYPNYQATEDIGRPAAAKAGQSHGRARAAVATAVSLLSGCLYAQAVLIPALAARLADDPAVFGWPTFAASCVLTLQHALSLVLSRVWWTGGSEPKSGVPKVREQRILCAIGPPLVGLVLVSTDRALPPLFKPLFAQSMFAGFGFSCIMGASPSHVLVPNGHIPSLPASSMLLAPCLSLVVGLWGWWAAMMFVVSLCLLCALIIILLLNRSQNPETEEENPCSTNPLLWPPAEPVPPSVLSVTADILVSVALNIPLGNLQLMLGLSSTEAAGIFVLIGASYLSGRLSTTWLLEENIGPLCTLGAARAASACLCAVLLLVASAPPTAGFRLALLFSGLGQLIGAWSAVPAAPIRSADCCNGFVIELLGLAGLPMTMLLVELTGCRQAGFYLSGMLMATSGLLYSLAILPGLPKSKMAGRA